MSEISRVIKALHELDVKGQQPIYPLSPRLVEGAKQMLDIIVDPTTEADSRDSAATTLVEIIAPEILRDSLKYKVIVDVLTGLTS